MDINFSVYIGPMCCFNIQGAHLFFFVAMSTSSEGSSAGGEREHASLDDLILDPYQFQGAPWEDQSGTIFLSFQVPANLLVVL
jgi:hypothetical protein